MLESPGGKGEGVRQGGLGPRGQVPGYPTSSPGFFPLPPSEGKDPGNQVAGYPLIPSEDPTCNLMESWVDYR